MFSYLNTLVKDFVYEQQLLAVLNKIKRQRVAIILEPGNVPVIERAIGNDESIKAMLLTAQIRGWVEVLHENIPTGQVSASGEMNMSNPFSSVQTYWKLTDSGWAAIQRRHQLSIFAFAVSVVGVVVAINA
ncbi:hypothetical protein HJ014_18840 [Vibrio parahaemolyticus]|nr:hypothetical protein [Vibrio parahaemolyticus]